MEIWSDSVFVEFDRETECVKKHPRTQICLSERKGKYIESVAQLTIFSEDNTEYKVTDSIRFISSGAKVLMSGAVSGEVTSNVLMDSYYGSVSNPFDATDTIHLSGVVLLNEKNMPGDSGAPLYTKPDSKNQVKIIGSISGNLEVGNSKRGFAFHWDDIAKDLKLSSIS